MYDGKTQCSSTCYAYWNKIHFIINLCAYFFQGRWKLKKIVIKTKFTLFFIMQHKTLEFSVHAESQHTVIIFVSYLNKQFTQQCMMKFKLWNYPENVTFNCALSLIYVLCTVLKMKILLNTSKLINTYLIRQIYFEKIIIVFEKKKKHCTEKKKPEQQVQGS